MTDYLEQKLRDTQEELFLVERVLRQTKETLADVRLENHLLKQELEKAQ